MSMHIEGPYLTTTGKRKGKTKHRTSLHAEKARKNAEAWKALLEKYDVKPQEPSKVRKPTKLATGPGNDSLRDPKRNTRHIPSLDTRQGLAARAPDKVYTGDAMIGIGQLHKSNAIPVFKAEDAVDISKMRRG